MIKKIKNIFNSIKNFFSKLLDIATLKSEVRYLRKENIELKLKERPYIDEITKLKSENRILKIQNTKLKKKVGNDEKSITYTIDTNNANNITSKNI